MPSKIFVGCSSSLGLEGEIEFEVSADRIRNRAPYRLVAQCLKIVKQIIDNQVTKLS
jgi:hypothetical protein